MTLSLKTLTKNDTQLNNALHHAECRYAEYRYAKCRGATGRRMRLRFVLQWLTVNQTVSVAVKGDEYIDRETDRTKEAE